MRVFYGHDAVPAAGEAVAGGSAKFQRLATRFPNHPTDFSLLYLGSTWLPRDLRPLLWHARRRRIPLLLNQNGVGYPGWAGAETDAFNRPLRVVLGAAEHVLYQSEFCKRAADELIGEPPGLVGGPPQRGRRPALHTGRARPRRRTHPAPRRRPVSGLPARARAQTLAALLPSSPDAQLLVTGRLVTPVEPLVERLGLRGHVHVLGRYSQADAPAVFRRAHVLLHTKVNDPCPSLVIEAMASGLPVVYARSGGVPELVGDDGGDRRAAPRRLRARRASERRGARRRGHTRGRRPTRVRVRGPATGGRAVRARALARPSRGALCALRAAVAANAAAERREPVAGSRPSSPTIDTSTPPSGRTSIRATTRAG